MHFFAINIINTSRKDDLEELISILNVVVWFF